jgi:ABC-2 type transport system permease protein
MSFRQIKLVLQREYMTKIRSKAFIIATILIPLGFVAFIGVTVAITLWETDSPNVTIAIVDETGELYPRLESINSNRYEDAANVNADSLRSMVTAEEIDGYILLDTNHVSNGKNPELLYGGSGGIALLNSIRNDLRDAIREERLTQANVSDEVQEIYSSSVDLDSRKITKQGEETEDNTGFLSGIGMLMGVIIFTALFGYGGLLTRSVIEEKTNRIVEVIASSVKPIELLIGKMMGVGALALTQITFWILAFLGISAAAAPIAGMFIDAPAGTGNIPGAEEAAASGFDPASLQIPSIDPVIFVWFLVFFLLGYLLYSTFFAAIGAAVDSETDTQQFMFPIMLPIMIAYLIMFRAIESPDSSLAVIGSLIPFTSPIVMITRIAITDVPIWQIGLSIVLMILTFFAALWLAAKIYRVGILSYGKSASYKELWKWIKQGN